MSLDPHQFAKVRNERYAQWEKSAPVACVVLAIAAVVSAYLLRPNLLVIAGLFIAGIANFFSRRALLQDNYQKSLVYVVVIIIFAMPSLMFVWNLSNVSKSVVLVQTFPWFTLGLFGPIWVVRRRNQAP